jgi:cell wall-associated NlpC family hydrolase
VHPPRQRGAVTAVAGLALVAGIAQPALAGRPEPPAAGIAGLRARAAEVQADIDRINAQVEMVVEEYDSNHEALTRTQAAQARTWRRIAEAARELAAGRHQLDQRVCAVYTGGSRAGALAELLGATSLHDALTTEAYQAGVVAGDQDAIARVEAARRGLQSLAEQLAGQLRAQRDLQQRLDQQRRGIERQLAEQLADFGRLTIQVRHAVERERQRQELLRRQALARRLAELHAAKLRVERERAAARARAAAGDVATTQVSQPKAATAAPAAPANSTGAPSAALAQRGKPYRWAGSGPGSFDCSGLTQAAYRRAGLSLRRVAAAQWQAGRHIDLGDLRGGDLVFFAYDLKDPRTIHHVGIYIGGGLMVEAPFTGANVRVSSIGRADSIGAVRTPS